jgi:hypothetical protein
MSIAFRVLGRDRLKALAAGLIFALHPVQSEAVIWITGRVDLLSGLGFLLGFYGFLRYREERRGHWIAVAWFAFVFGIFAKESCLVLPFVALAYDLLSPQARTRLQACAPYGGWLLLMGVYAYCRSFGMNLIQDLDGIDWWGEVPYALQRAALYAASMFIFRDVMNWAGEWMTPYLGALGLLVIVGSVALAVWAASPAARQSKPLRWAFFFSLVWPAVTLAPLVITYFSRRHLYTASAGFAIGVAALLTHVWPQRRAFGVAAVSVTVVAAAQLWMGMPRWQWAQARSREISETVAELALRAEAGDVLLLDIPATYHGRWVWAWSSPFALRPPFQLQDLTRRLVVIEPPDVYHPSYFWPRAGTVPRLKNVDAGWLISGRPDQPMMVRELSAEEVNYLRDEESLSEPEAFDRLIERVGGRLNLRAIQRQ